MIFPIPRSVGRNVWGSGNREIVRVFYVAVILPYFGVPSISSVKARIALFPMLELGPWEGAGQGSVGCSNQLSLAVSGSWF